PLYGYVQPPQRNNPHRRGNPWRDTHHDAVERTRPSSATPSTRIKHVLPPRPGRRSHVHERQPAHAVQTCEWLSPATHFHPHWCDSRRGRGRSSTHASHSSTRPGGDRLRARRNAADDARDDGWRNDGAWDDGSPLKP